jgi:PAS domain S-box-containing protein
MSGNPNAQGNSIAMLSSDQNELLYRSLFDRAEHAILVYARDTTILALNPVAANNLGGSIADCVGKSLQELVPSKYELTLTRLAQVIDSGEVLHVEDWVDLANGRMCFASTLQVIRNFQPGVDAVQAIAIDITTQKQAEADLRRAYVNVEYQVKRLTQQLTEANRQLQREITKHLATVDALSASETRYRLLFENSNDGIFVHDLTGQILNVNQTVCDCLGYSYAELLTKNVLDLHPEEDRAIGQVALDSLIQVSQVRFEVRFQRSDGELVHGEISAKLVDRDKGIVQGICRDITDRKAIEAALSKSEADQRIILDTIPDLLIRMDGAGNYLDVVPGEDILLIKSLEETLQANIYDIMPLYLAEQRMQLVQTALATGQRQIYEYEIEVRGQLYYEEARIVVSDENEVLVIIRNTTDRKEAEIALRTSEERYRLLSTLSPVGIWKADPAGKRIYANERECQIAGQTEAELLGDGWLNAVFPGDRERVRTDCLNFLVESRQGNATEIDFEYRFLHADGTIVWAWTQVVVERDQNGQIIGYIGAVIDISDRKAAEIALRESEARYRLLTALSPVGIWRADPNGLNTYANEKTILVPSLISAIIKQPKRNCCIT